VNTHPSSVGGGFGIVPAAPIDTTRKVPEARHLSPREAQALMQAELLQAIRSLVDSSTEISSRLGRRGAVNGVLDVFLDTIPTAGFIQRDYPVTVGSVGIINHSAATAVIVHSGPAGPTAPASGRGVQRIEPGSYLVMPVADRTFAIWGASLTVLSVQVFTGLQPWGAGVL
jgi:hypothetical protein